MQLKWYGHSCFLLTAADGTRILTDPCDPEMTGYRLPRIETDIVTISHGHHDHNYLAAAAGKPAVIDTAGAHEARGISITGVPTWHDDVQGAKRGANLVFTFEIDGLRVAHLGDLGEIPPDAAFTAIGPVDVLLCPVGGFYTIDAGTAWQVTERLRPRVIVPMHYKTPVNHFPIAGVDDFLAVSGETPVRRVDGTECELEPKANDTAYILLLDFAGKE